MCFGDGVKKKSDIGRRKECSDAGTYHPSHVRKYSPTAINLPSTQNLHYL